MLCEVLVPSANLLVREEGAVLQGGQVTAEQGSTRPVVLTKDGAVDVVESVPRHQTVPTRGTCETLKVVDVSLRPHHHLTGWNRLSTCTAGPTVTKQPDVVGPAEDHAPFAVAGGADLTQLGLAA